MTALFRCLLLLFFFCIPVLSHAAPQRARLDPVLLILPASALQQTLSSLLPLPLEQLGADGQGFQGRISIESLKSLVVDRGQIIVTGQLSGHDLSVNASVGSQNINVQLGSLTLPVVCKVTLSFDPARRLLLLTPVFQALSSGNQAEEGLLTLLNGLSREYQLPLHDFLPLTGQLGSALVRLHTEPLNIRAEKGAITLWLRPSAEKLRR